MEVAVKPEATPLPQRNSAANVQTTPQVKPLIPAKTEAGSVPMQVDATFVAPNNATGERKNNRNSNFGGQRGRGGAGGGGNGGGNNNAGGGGNNNRFNNRGGGGGGNNSGNNNNRNNQNNFQNRRQNPQNKQNQDGNESVISENRSERNHQKGQNNRNQRNGGGGEEFLIHQKLNQLKGPLHEIPTIKYEEVKFSGRNRLYIGNLTSDISEEELKELFKPYGEVSEIFLNAEKFFAFIKVDYRSNAEKAKRDLDGFMRNNRALRVRFAPNATTVRVKNLTPHVSNELLYRAFEIFGLIERAVIIVDDRGKPTGEGIVEFTRKSGAMAAIRYCTEKCYFLTSSLRPCVCDLFEHSDDTDGYPEKSLNKKNPDFFNARETGPRFAELNSFEHEYGTRWKQLHELFKKKHEALSNEMKMEEEKLEAQMEYARYEHETEMLRNRLRLREQDRDQMKTNWEMKEKYADEQRMKSEEQMRRAQEEMAVRMNKQEEELRRRQQENTLFMQAQQLSSLLDAQENNQNNNLNMGGIGGNNVGNMGGGGGGGGGGGNDGNMNQRKNFNGPNRNNFQQGGMGGGGGGNPDFNDFGQNNRGNQGGGGGNNGNNGGNMGGNRGGGGGGGQRGQWNNNNQQQNDGGFQNNNNNKRRRF